MAKRVLILSASPGQNQVLSRYFQAIELESYEFLDESRAFDWLKTQTSPVDLILLGESNEGFLNDARSTTAGRFSMGVKVVSQGHREWMNLVLSASQIVDNILVKPFRASVLLDRIDRLSRLRGTKSPGALIINDSGDPQDLLQEYLNHAGFSKVTESAVGAPLREVLNRQANDFGLAVCAWEMPSREGLESIREIRNSRHFGSLPLIVVTSQLSIDRIRAAQSADSAVDALLQGPLESSGIRAKMEPIFAKLEARRKFLPLLETTWSQLSVQQFDLAIETLERALISDPTSLLLLEASGDAWARKAREVSPVGWLGAAKHYEKATQLEPANVVLSRKCVEAHSSLDSAEETIRVSRQHLFRFGFDAEARVSLGKAYLKAGDYGAACVELRRALNFYPSHSEATSLLQVATSLQSGEPELKKAA